MTNDRKMLNLAYDVIETLGGDVDILSMFGSYGDTMPDEEMIKGVEDWLEKHRQVDTTRKVTYKS